MRQSWVAIKPGFTAAASVVPALHAGPIAGLARQARHWPIAVDDFGAVRQQLVVKSVAATVLLLAMTVLSIYKPKGRFR